MIDRTWPLARLVGRANELTDDALLAGLAFAESLPSRSLDPRALERDTPHPRPALPHHAAIAGEVVQEVGRAERKHGDAMPGGFGLAGRPIDRELMLRATDTCDAARDTTRAVAAGASARHRARPRAGARQAAAARGKQQQRQRQQRHRR